mmetsp:Transcript_6503/g.12474  ORF Transcript_6503/g.12474 Transcript_6503/m.12474 type:complete len:221 (-) Transcript_6503:319-981(-)
MAAQPEIFLSLASSALRASLTRLSFLSVALAFSSSFLAPFSPSSAALTARSTGSSSGSKSPTSAAPKSASGFSDLRRSTSLDMCETESVKAMMSSLALSMSRAMFVLASGRRDLWSASCCSIWSLLATNSVTVLLRRRPTFCNSRTVGRGMRYCKSLFFQTLKSCASILSSLTPAILKLLRLLPNSSTSRRFVLICLEWREWGTRYAVADFSTSTILHKR